MYDAIVVLSYKKNLDGSLSAQTRSRVDEGIKLLDSSKAPIVIFSGGNPENYSCSQAESMSRYAISKGVDIRKILLEDKSLDTFGNAFFAKRIIKRHYWKKLLIVSHAYHIQRTKIFFDFIFGRDYTLDYVGIEKNITSKLEGKLLDLFRETFKDIEKGDDAAIQKRMFERHIHYIGKEYLLKN